LSDFKNNNKCKRISDNFIINRTSDHAHPSSRASKNIKAEDWKTQTYQKIQNMQQEFEPIIENPIGEAYGTALYKRNKNKK